MYYSNSCLTIQSSIINFRNQEKHSVSIIGRPLVKGGYFNFTVAVQSQFLSNFSSLDMVQHEWETIKTDNIHYNKTREISFTLSLTHPMGPKHSRVTETQVNGEIPITGTILV